MTYSTIPGYPKAYEVSSSGIVRSTFGTHVHVMKANLTHGYERVTIRDSGRARVCGVHRLVALAFIPNPHNKPCVHHRDRNRSNNSVENLEWVTVKENSDYAVKAGSILRGENHPMTRLSDRDVVQIKSYIYDKNHTLKELSRMYNVSDATISILARGGRNSITATRGGLGYVSIVGQKQKAAPHTYGDDMVLRVKKLLNDGHSRKAVMSMTAMSECFVQRVATGKRTVSACAAEGLICASAALT